jgi:hypothetical protein
MLVYIIGEKIILDASRVSYAEVQIIASLYPDEHVRSAEIESLSSNVLDDSATVFHWGEEDLFINLAEKYDCSVESFEEESHYHNDDNDEWTEREYFVAVTFKEFKDSFKFKYENCTKLGDNFKKINNNVYKKPIAGRDAEIIIKHHNICAIVDFDNFELV